jgi:ribosomal protein S18 acetylase RimI-like enzyme
VGPILAGHDGRRGFIHHLAVRKSHRRLGIGRQLVSLCRKALRAEHIEKCHLFVYQSNRDAIDFWLDIGFTRRSELAMLSQMTEVMDE